MPRYPKKSILFPAQQTFSCPVQGCRKQVRSHWGFTKHVRAIHPGMDLQYPGNEGQLVQIPSSDVDQISSPPPSLNAFSQDERTPFSAEPNLDPSEVDESVPADSTEFHPLINGMYINYYIIFQYLNE